MYGADTDEEGSGGKNEDKQHDGVGQVVGQYIEYEFASIRAREDSSFLLFNEIRYVLSILDDFHTENLR